MTKKFCPKCGRLETEQDSLLAGVCKDCLSESTPLLKEYKNLKLVICPSCKSFLHKNKWHPPLDEENSKNILKIIKKYIPEKIKIYPHIRITSLDINPDLSKGTKSIEVNVSLKSNNLKEDYVFLIKPSFSMCNLCKKRKSSYFESIIQIRPKDEGLLKFIKNDLEQNEKIFISSFKETKHGYDLNLTSRKYISAIIPKVKKKFNIESKITRTLYGRKEGKEVYRITLLLRVKNAD